MTKQDRPGTPQPLSQSPSSTVTNNTATFNADIPFQHAKSLVRVRPWVGNEATVIPDKQIVPRPALEHLPPNVDTGIISTIVVLDPANRFKPKKGGEYSCDCVLWSFTDDAPSNGSGSPASPQITSPAAYAKLRAAPGIPATQADCYNAIGAPLADCLMEGYNVACVVAGGPGSGKSYTLIGDEYWSGEPRGILPRFLFDVFHRQQKGYRDDITSSVEVEAYAINNDTIVDLQRKTKLAAGEELKVREDAEGATVQGGTRTVVEDVMALEPLLKAIVQRFEKHHSAEHYHLVLTIRVVENWTFADPTSPEATLTKQRRSFAMFVMLQGSHLGFQRCIEAAIARDTGEHATAKIPSRDSHLTRLCAEIFGGSCNTTFVHCVSPYFEHVKDTTASLAYAARLNAIKCNAKVNTDNNMSELRKLDDEVRGLSLEVQKTNETINVIQEELDRRTETLREKQRIAAEHKKAFEEQDYQRQLRETMRDIVLVRIKHSERNHKALCQRITSETKFVRDEEASLKTEAEALKAAVVAGVAAIAAGEKKSVDDKAELSRLQKEVNSHQNFEGEVREQEEIIKSSASRQKAIRDRHQERQKKLETEKKTVDAELVVASQQAAEALKKHDTVRDAFEKFDADRKQITQLEKDVEGLLANEKTLQDEIKQLETEIKQLEDEKAKQGCCTVS